MIQILDVSSHQGRIDWPAVAASGLVAGVYCKLTEGAHPPGNIDARGLENVAGARAAGLPVGAYHFFSSLSSPEDQRRNLLEQLDAGGPLDLPVMVDVESNAGGRFPTLGALRAFLGSLRADLPAGAPLPLLYTGSWVAEAMAFHLAPELAQHPGWVAAYGQRAAPPPCAPWGAWGSPTGPLGWQYTGAGRVPGIAGDCDLSRFWRMPGLLVDEGPTEP